MTSQTAVGSFHMHGVYCTCMSSVRGNMLVVCMYFTL